MSAASPPRRRVALLINPAAGRHDPARLDRLAEALVGRGLETEVVVSRSPGDLAQRLCEVEADVVAVSGGDGTINEVVGALVARSGRMPQLAVVPDGTANVLAHEYRLPRHIEAIAEAISRGRTRPLHLGTAQLDGEGPRPFFLMTSIGFDAEVVRAVEDRSPRRFKKVVFALEAVRRGFGRRSRLHVAAVTARGERLAFDCALAVVTKARHYGGPFVLVDGVAMDRPGLRLVALADDRPAALMRAAWGVATRRLERMAGVTVVDVVSATVTTADGGPVAVQIDGEPHGATPVEVNAAPHVLELIVAEA
ncbi:diacylglycerol/lipid kinase family protein [Pinisolibacter sp.]|uniref:diacylglycerol/lipid kinase family protein n=1 Tax=Pinisolibacter sp. TaxID=2172024 RepID=UPI002FDCC5F7